jgi:hypothetical protein
MFYLSLIYFSIDTARVVEEFCITDDFYLKVKQYLDFSSPALMPDTATSGWTQSYLLKEPGSHYPYLSTPSLTFSALSNTIGRSMVLGKIRSYFPGAVSCTHCLELFCKAMLDFLA